MERSILSWKGLDHSPHPGFVLPAMPTRIMNPLYFRAPIDGEASLHLGRVGATALLGDVVAWKLRPKRETYRQSGGICRQLR